jgi:transposase
LSTKIHALVENMGQLGSFTLTAGQVHDVTEARGLLVGIDTEAVVADKAFDSDELIDFIREGEAKAVIPARSNRRRKRRLDRKRYRERNLIERFFCRLKHFRRIATRYDKLAQRYASFIALTAAVVWLGGRIG